MSNHQIVLGRVFQGREAANVQIWLNAWAAKGWEFVTLMPTVETGHGMYIFRNSGDGRLDFDELCNVPELSPELSDQ